MTIYVVYIKLKFSKNFRVIILKVNKLIKYSKMCLNNNIKIWCV